MAHFGNKSNSYQYAIDQASIVSITDGDGNITYVNDNFCKISGYTRDELIGQNHRLINANYHDRDFFEEMWDTLLKGNTWSGEVCNRAKEGSVYWVKTTITPVKDIKGEIIEMISIREDITSMKNMENLFAEQNKTLGFVLDSEHTGIFQYIFKEDRLKYDDNLLHLLGVEKKQLGKSLDEFLSLFPLQDKNALNHRIRHHIYNEYEFFEYVTNYRTQKNDIRKIRIYGKVLRRGKHGQPEILVGLVKDLTEQFKLESLLLRTQRVVKIGSWEYDMIDNDLVWSPSNYMIYGYRPYSFTPTVESFYDEFVVPEYREKLREVHQKALTDGVESFQIDLPIYTAEKEERWVRHIVHTEKIENEVYKLYGTTQDIHDQKMLELDLQKSMKKVDMALETAGFGIGEINYDTKSIHVDDFLKGLFGLDYLERDVLFSDIRRAVVVEDFEEVNSIYNNAIARKETIVNAQFRVITDEGSIRFIQSRGILDYHEDGQVHSVLGLFWDISQDKEFENILIETKNKAEEATNLKSSFLASMSHEIRTPMNGVMGMLELLMETSLDAEQRKLVETMKVCGDNLLTVVNDVLDLSKIEAGKLIFEKRKFDLHQMMRHLYELFDVTAQKKGISFNLHLDKSLPQYIVMDEVRLRQVLTNLLSNAFKFTNSGSIDLMIYSNQPALKDTTISSSEGSITFIIRDTGIGISESQMDKLFLSFTQLDASTTRKYGGTGLGLVISKSLVEKMGGNIKVKSEIGLGTSFKFNILCEFSNQLIEENIDHSQIQFRRDLNVLVAEDNPINQTLIRSMLERLGLNIELVDNGALALSKAKEKSYDLIFMDLQMPVMDGIEATENILNIKGSGKKPLIVAMTANVFEEDRNRCFTAGMSDFIPKPLSIKLIKSILSKYFPDYDSEVKTLEINMEKQSSKYTLINESQILFEFEDDFDIFEELVIDYQSRFKAMVENIQVALDHGNAEGVKVAGHTLKGVVANFYSKDLTNAAFQIELSGSNGDLSALSQQLSQFLNYNDGVLAELESFIKENKDKSPEAA